MKNPKNNTKDFIWNAAGLTLNACNSLFFLIVVRFINGLDAAGIFTYTFALCIFLYTFIIYYNRSFQVSDIKNKFSFNSYLTCRIVTSIIGFVFILAFALINQFSVLEIGIVLLLAGFRIIEAISDCFYGAIQKKHQLFKTGISLSLKAVLGLLFFFIVDLLTHSLLLALLALILVNLTLFFLYDLRVYRKLYTDHIKLDFSHLKPIFKACFPVFVFSALAIYLSNCQKYILPYFEPDDVQAIFGILIMPATVLSLAGAYLINPFINLFTRHHERKNYTNFITSTKKLLFAMIGIGALALIICYFIGIPLLELIFQLNLSIYQGSLMLIVLASIFYAMAMIFSSLLTILGENHRQAYIYFISALAATIIAIVLIPTYSINGAVYSFLISSFVLIALYVGLLQFKLHGVKNDR